MKNKVASIVFEAMFGEERVNNSVALLSRGFGHLFSWSNFSVGCCNSLSLCPFTRDGFVNDCHTSTGVRWDGYTALRATSSFHWTCSYARVACFVFETNQHLALRGYVC